MSEATVPEPFDYGSLDEHTRLLVQQKADETHGLLKRTAESIIAIGNNLLTVQKLLPEMKFSAWLRAEFDLSRQSAYNFMRVATRFDGSCKTVLQLPAKVLYELASSSDAIVEQVERGQLPPTIDAIRVAKEAERQAREAERLALAEVQTRQAMIGQLTRELAEAQQELIALSQAEVQIKEVEKPVVPPEVTAQLAALHQKVSEITQQRDRQKKVIQDLQEATLASETERLEVEHERQIRIIWYKITSEFQRSLRSILSQWPSPLDVLAFEADDWTRLSHVKVLARRFLDECIRLTEESHTTIVEGSSVSSHEAKEKESVPLS